MAFEHTERVEALLRQGKRKEASELHNKHLTEQFAKAKQGEVINLSDLMAGKEAFILDDIEKGKD